MTKEMSECLEFLVADFVLRTFEETTLLSIYLRTWLKVILARNCEQRCHPKQVTVPGQCSVEREGRL